MTIHCVTPNPAVDVTYRLPTVRLHAVNRIDQVTQRPGGKGVNVARLLAAAGRDVATYGFLGGSTGQQLSDLLHRLQPAIQQRWTATASDTRLTIAVVDDRDTTMFNEPGRAVTDDDWEHLTAAVTTHCGPGDVVTISGSLPAGSTPGHLGTLVARSRDAGATVVVDTSGPALLAAAHPGAHVLKPNQHELLEITGATDVQQGAAALLDAGCQAVVASLGADGLLLATSRHAWTARLDEALSGNPTGAGDALVAALAQHLATGSADNLEAALLDALPDAVGWSAAAVLSPVAGEIDPRVADQLTRHVILKEL